jgi:hypothetical protein
VILHRLLHAMHRLALLTATACGGSEPIARHLDARAVFDVAAVRYVQQAGYTVSSALCELESPATYLPDAPAFGSRLFFHAFRIRRSPAAEEHVVLFASNHDAASGIGLTIAVNDGARRITNELMSGTSMRAPVTPETPGASEALDCAQKAGPPPKLVVGNLDLEAWRRQTIRRFGPEREYKDGSKEEYVQLALELCKDDASQARAGLGDQCAGSIQEHIAETFCPHLRP